MTDRRHLNPAEARTAEKKDPNWRKAEGDAARKALEDGARRNAQISEDDDKLVEAAQMQAMQFGLPVTWQDGGKKHMPIIGRRAPVVSGATAQEVENYAKMATRTCGSCRYFDLKVGQNEMIRQRFAERLVLEQDWKLQHLGAPVDHMGMCKASGGTMVTSTVTSADSCDQYRPKSRLFG